jgi:hypothetical protein
VCRETNRKGVGGLKGCAACGRGADEFGEKAFKKQNVGIERMAGK